jgi:hypothetical protein
MDMDFADLFTNLFLNGMTLHVHAGELYLCGGGMPAISTAWGNGVSTVTVISGGHGRRSSS